MGCKNYCDSLSPPPQKKPRNVVSVIACHLDLLEKGQHNLIKGGREGNIENSLKYLREYVSKLEKRFKALEVSNFAPSCSLLGNNICCFCKKVFGACLVCLFL